MARLLDFNADNLVVEKLDKQQAQEALFYLDVLLEQSGEPESSMKLLNLQTNILQRLTILGSGQEDSKQF
ncbi:hypothetical protein [Adhaeribacter arboris]|nr:hypothetical protein [Adhaeribacter arboris]